VLGLDHALRLENVLDGFGDLGSELLLDLQPAGEAGTFPSAAIAAGGMLRRFSPLWRYALAGPLPFGANAVAVAISFSDVAELTGELPEADASVDLTLCLYSVLSRKPAEDLCGSRARYLRALHNHGALGRQHSDYLRRFD
jgi:hypothetical protein